MRNVERNMQASLVFCRVRQNSIRTYIQQAAHTYISASGEIWNVCGNATKAGRQSREINVSFMSIVCHFGAMLNSPFTMISK